MRKRFSEEKSRFLTPKNGVRNDKRLSYRNVRNAAYRTVPVPMPGQIVDFMKIFIEF